MEVINFKLFIIFLLSTTGLTFITNRSKLFQPLREWITQQYIIRENERLGGSKKYRFSIHIFWWMAEVSGCYMCASMYTGSLMAIISYLSVSLPWVIYVMYPFASVPVVCIVIQYWIKTEKK